MQKDLFKLGVYSVWIILPCTALYGQAIPAERTTDWSLAGIRSEIPAIEQMLNILDLGGSGDGATSNNAALNAAFAAAAGEMTVIEFPAGDYFFTAGIDIPDRVIIRGEGSDATTFTFSLGGNGHCINIAGTELPQTYPIVGGALRGDTIFSSIVNDPLDPGDLIRLYRNDADLVFSSWAIGTAGQLAHVSSVGNAAIMITSPLRAHYGLEGSYWRKMDPAQYVGIECLKIVREDQTEGQWSNILLIKADHCWVRGVESDMTNFAHIEISESTNCEITGNYLHHAFGYGSGGKAYGVDLTNTAGENLIADNVFEHLRHSMIVQIGANGNVLAYNHSTDPFWEEGFWPANAAGDIVLHGDHPYLNLFEGNIVQNIVIDDSHGSNGPFNTFFRNEANLYGYVMSNNPPTDSINIVGNVIPGTTNSFFTVTGEGHFMYGNLYQGNLVPESSGNLTTTSYYIETLPAYLLPIESLPQIGPNAAEPGTIPAEMRFLAGNSFTVCPSDITTAVIGTEQRGEFSAYPNPFTDRIV
ncbi:MAG: hypothetical protein M3R08_08490, partial [Bacteroidota bacterium]|nr:hypothetical protein [Bacteroidota bacterium]